MDSDHERRMTFARRLNRLAELIESRRWWQSRVYMRTWVKRKWFCGTVACVAGHAALDPEFQGEGFRLARHGRYVIYGDSVAFEACRKFFGTSSVFEIEAYGTNRPTNEQVAAQLRAAALQFAVK